MKKLCVLLIACVVLFAGCGDDFLDNNGGNSGGNTGNNPGDNTGNNPGDNTGNNPGGNTGNNPGDNTGNNPGGNTGNNPGNNTGGNQNTDVIGIWTGSYTYTGNTTAGSIKLDISESTWILVFTNPGGILTNYNGTWTRSGNILTLYRSGYSSATASLSGNTLILNQPWTSSGYNGPTTSELTKSSSGGGEPLGGTTLRIRNESPIGITDVVWNNVEFTTGQGVIRTGSNEIKNVTAGTGYIHFKREGNPIAVRTATITVVTQDEPNEFVFRNETNVFESSNPSNTATLQTFFSKSWIYIKQDTDVINLYGEHDFGSVLPSNNKDVVFTIENIGVANLSLESVDGKRVNLDENDAGLFSIIQQPLASTVAPGITTTFTVRFSPVATGNNFSATVLIKTNSQNAEEFAFRVKGSGGRIYKIGDTGPGGGIVFYAEGGQYKECSGELGISSRTAAMTTASNYKGGGFTNWKLPDRSELTLMYQNLHVKSLGGFSNANYWSSTYENSYYYYVNFSNGSFNSHTSPTGISCQVRAVRSFSE